ncbi:hypothetical protein PGT21_033208 [Puccinia graminis f. sp. tritici]|uniref:Uncharacterized protein n=1 Tax=Puccinia graminis f. sp. tritici TaxID=56615 RepID=A0A5B0QXZ4_PUCGR|nr:hypothetical protein PGT21_033208 [Puccinia graminis f. sp. tritici]
MQRLENAVDQLNAKNDSVCRRLAEVEAILRTGPKPSVQPTLKPNGDTPKSFAAVTSAHLDGSIHAPKSRPPPAQVIASLKPKRVIIHSNPANTTLKDVPSGALVQKANEALIGLDARVDGESVAIRGAIHPDLEATPSTYSVMAHGVPKSFDIGKPTNLASIGVREQFPSHGLGSRPLDGIK